MKNILIAFSIILLSSISAWSQGGVTLLIGDGVGDTGNEVCIDFSVRDFTAISAMDSVIFFWDPSELTFNQAQNFNLMGLDATNFTLDNAAGTLMLSWTHNECVDNVGVPGTGITIEDGTVIFQLCFTTLGAFGNVADINIMADPITVERDSNCKGIASFRNTGHIYTGVTPVVFSMEDISGNTGDLVCAKVSVSGFEDMASGQFTLVWDETIAEFENVTPNDGAGGIDNLVSNNFNGSTPGVLTMSWASIPNQPVTVADGTEFFEVCFRLVGECEMNTQLLLGLAPTQLEFTNETVPGQLIPTFFQGGLIEVGSCDQNGLQLSTDCGGPYNLNDQFCVPITVGDNFQNISDMAFSMTWSSSILEFQGVQNINASIIGFDNGSFNLSSTGVGVLGINWARMPGGFPNESLNAGEVLFEVCFKVVGLGGNSPLNFVQNGSNVQVADGDNIGINPDNCEVIVNQPDKVIMQLGTGEAATGDQFCIPVNISNFQDIISYQFQLNWNAALYEFSGVSNINIPGVTEAGNFVIGVDALLFDWDTVDPVSLADGSSIFELCFTPLSGPGNCESIFMVEGGILVPTAVSSTSNGENIGVVSTPGELCTLFPEGFGLTVNEVEGDWNGNTCVGLTVASFDNITDATFTINWDIAALTYTGFNDPTALSGLQIDESNIAVGAITVSWSDAAGVALADATEILQLCFDLVGAPRDCYPISINNGANAPVVSTLNGPGSIVIDNGEICINEHFYITNTVITPVSCYDVCDGTITVEVLSSQGTTGLNFQWNDPEQFQPYQATNLCEGEVSLTIYDSGNPMHMQDFTFTVPISDALPEADAGADVELNCVPPIVVFTGTGSEGGVFASQWVKIPSGELVSPSATAQTFDPGLYKYIVTNTETGCAVMDTMQVFPPVYPDVDAGEDVLYNCLSDTVQLAGVETAGAAITYLWEVIDGTSTIVQGDETVINPRVTGPGEFTLTVTNLLNGCLSFDNVFVNDFREYPDATANFGMETIPLACDTTVALNADSSIIANPAVVVYQWYDILNEPIVGSSTVAVGEVGTYYLVATNPVSMCEATDTIKVIPNADFPQITTLQDTLLTCDNDVIQLVTSIDAGGQDFTFSWNELSGGPLVGGTETDLSPMADAPGIYQVEAINTATNCRATAEITIAIDTVAPVAFAGIDTFITCTNFMVELSAEGSTLASNISFTWTNEGGDVVSNDMTATVTTPGIYCVEVKNTTTGCSATDCVNVEARNINPQIFITTPNQSFTCLIDTLTLMPDSISPMFDGYIFEWTMPGGAGEIIGGTDGLSIMTAVEGIYRLTVSNPETGCTGANEFVVNTDITLPVVNAGDDANITCANETITIGAETTEMGDGIEYIWTNIVDGELPAPNNEKLAMVSTPGTYELMVTNTNSGCVARDTIEVGEDKVAPTISAEGTDMITCAVECVEVSVTVTDVAAFDVSWQGLNGEDVTDSTSATATVCAAGMYEVSIMDQSNGCVSKDTVEVMENVERDEIMLNDIDDFKCSDEFVTIDASGTGPLSDYSSIVWTTETGFSITPSTGSLTVNVGGPGEYTLSIVRADNGCESTALISVNDDMEPPIANAGMDIEVECGIPGVLNGGNSSVGPDYSYEWTVVSGGTLSGDLTGLMPEASGDGTYQLLVTNTANGCTATSEVSSILVYPDGAATMDDVTICGDSLEISANLPMGTTGEWTVGGFVQLASASSNVTIATALGDAANRFIWTLSIDGCPDYSSDTLIVFSEGNPIANNDLLTLEEGEQTGSVNIVANDILSNPNNWEITILTQPDIGVIDSLVNGVIYYSVGVGVSGETEFDYMICSLDCPDQCDEATVLVTIPASNEDIDTPNTITPNGDGINDIFVIDQIANNPADKFPDNELIVFNRWGDIVYQAKPYANDWNGTNQSGQDLPEGTYYYLLRLNISEGDILRGDITIVK